MPATHSDSAEFSHAFEIKSGGINLPLLKLLIADVEIISQHLSLKIKQAPDFFRNAPMAIDLHGLDNANVELDLAALVRVMRSCGLVPVGVCGGFERQHQAAQAAGLTVLTLARQESPQQAHTQAAKPKTQPEESHGRIVEQPVRSGQRIYAEGDLIVLAPVSAGAEVIAEGNIHIYSTLRGRALAGVPNNTDARIFCSDLQAELISIAGNYQVSSNFSAPKGKPVQIYLQEQSLIIKDI